MRVAWFSPFPPSRTGVATCSGEAVAALRTRGHLIDPYPETAAHDFPWIHRQRPYDLVVYQFGNSSHHDYAWPYALRYPGLVVLHDTRLHHARAALLLRERRIAEYRRELAGSEPGLSPDAAELAIAGFDSRLYYDWPMVRALVDRARLVAVHGEATRRELMEAISEDLGPGTDKLVAIRLGHGETVTPARERAARAAIRARYGIDRTAIVFGVFGGLTPEKRMPQILAAFRATLPYAPDARLLLGGARAGHTHVSSRDDADIADRVTRTGYLEDAELTDHIAAVDVSLNLRWPTARETSGPWLRALAAGKPTIVTDLRQLTDVASLDPRTWQSPADRRHSSPIAVAVDILDEDHSLRLAMRRLATDADLRAALGRAGRDYWQREHTVEAMADDYARLLDGLRADQPMHAPAGPDGAETLRDLLQPFGIESPL